MPGCSSPPVTSASRRNRCAAARVVGVLIQDLLERHLAVQFLVEGDEHLAQPAAGVGPQDAEPLAVGCRGPRPIADGDAGFVNLEGGACADPGKRGLDVGITQAGEVLASRAAGVDRRQAFLDVVAMLLDVAPTMNSTAARSAASRSPRAMR